MTYYPEKSFSEQTGNLDDLDELAEECQKILNTEYSDKLDELYRLGGTSGGARPKIMTDDQWGRMDHKISCPRRWERYRKNGV